MKKLVLFLLPLLMIFIAHFILVAENNVTYNADIKSLITAKGCSECHPFTLTYNGLLEQKSELNNGIPLVNPAKPDSSVLIWRIEGKTLSGSPLIRMPQGGPYYSEEEINIFRTWITQGALEDIVVDVEESTWSEIKMKFK